MTTSSLGVVLANGEAEMSSKRSGFDMPWRDSRREGRSRRICGGGAVKASSPLRVRVMVVP